LTFDIEESSSKTVSRFQVDLKQNRLRSTKLVVEVSKIVSTRLRSLKSTRVDLNRLTPRSNLDDITVSSVAVSFCIIIAFC